jgi:CheY-like chemotaxis protein
MKKSKPGITHRDSDISIASAAYQKIKILVIDDDPGIRDILSIIFERAGYAVEIKSDPEDLINNNYSLPQLFIVDKRLSSSITGLDICRHLKSNNATSSIPVIMLSASPDIGLQSKLAGANSFVEKPFEIAYLLKLVNYYTGNRRSGKVVDFSI